MRRGGAPPARRSRLRRALRGCALVAAATVWLAAGRAQGASEGVCRLSEYLSAALRSGPSARQARLEREQLTLQEQLDRERRSPTLSAQGFVTLLPNFQGSSEVYGGSDPGGVGPPGGKVELVVTKGGEAGVAQADSGAATGAAVGGRATSSDSWRLSLSVEWRAQTDAWRWNPQPAQVALTYSRPLRPPDLTEPDRFEARRLRLAQRQRQMAVDALQRFYALQEALAAYRTAWGRATLARQRYEATQALVELGAKGPADEVQAHDELAKAQGELREVWRRTRDALVAFTSTAGLSLPAFAAATTPPAPEDLKLELVDDLAWGAAFRSLAALLGLEEGSRLDASVTWQRAGQDEALLHAWRTRALDADPDVADARFAVQEAEVRLARARQAAGPSLELSAGVSAALEAGRVAQPRLTLSLSQPLWAPAARLTTHEAAVALEAARERLRSTEEQAFRQLEQAWWDLGQALVAADDARSSLSRAEESLERAARRQASGLALPLDVEQAALAVEQARAQLDAARNRIRLAWLRLATLVGIEPPALHTAAPSGIPG